MDELAIKRHKAIWSAVILQAISDYQRELRAGGIHHAEKSEPGQYFLSNSNRHGGFIWVCSVFDISPDNIRNRLNTRELMAEMKKAYTAQLKHMKKREREARE